MMFMKSKFKTDTYNYEKTKNCDKLFNCKRITSEDVKLHQEIFYILLIACHDFNCKKHE